MIAFDEEQMPAAGYTLTGDSVENRNDRQIRRLQYTPSDPASERVRVTVWIVADPSGDFGQVSFRQRLDPAVAQAFGGWPEGLPLIEGAQIRDASFLTGASRGRRASLSTDFQVQLSEEEARAQFTAGLEGSPWSLSPDDDSETDWMNVVGEHLDDVTIHFHETSDGTSTRVAIHTRFEVGTIPASAPAPGTEAPAEAPGTEAPAPGTEEAPAGTEGPEAAPGTEAPAAASAPASGAATLEEMNADVAALLGPTDNLAQTVSPYLTLPEGLPEPAGITVHEVTFRFNPVSPPTTPITGRRSC